MGYGLTVTYSGVWKVISASVAGTGHVRAGLPCQDAHDCLVLPRGLLLIAVADGAGSAQYGQLGASLAVESSLRFCAEQAEGLHEELQVQKHLIGGLCAARERLEHEAETQQVELRELACTLLLVAATPRFVAAAQIGDGTSVGLFPNDTLRTLTRPPQTEYVNETLFLTSSSSLEAAQFVFQPEAPWGIAVTTDGLQRLALKLPQGEPHAPFFLPLFRFAANTGSDSRQQLENFLRSPRIAERTDDDLTLVLAVRRCEPHGRTL
ncbi:serine/threonine protein phosphatase [Chthonomonas calidirosea]|uniref:Serine/threonine protein phosphatase n=1 Tax=Chthonomonas calidirosea (strain DSM 23976 / ICMP 18418 / T49) TaxID=1303518 RepID=S0EY21_CHTCT|nr:Serine/threonine protein phosphatase [Chthonomonas calidirosea T49]CEK17392.1 serine/threonine protein phosphatase [Chthonomonas calidirosea]